MGTLRADARALAWTAVASIGIAACSSRPAAVREPLELGEWAVPFGTALIDLPRHPQPGLPNLVVDRDNFVVTQSCRLHFKGPVADADGNGVVHVTGEGAWVDLGGGTLEGCPAGTPPDRMTGTGIRIDAPNAIVVNGSVRGFKVGVHVRKAGWVRMDLLDLSGNHATRLRSTPEREDEADWLRPQRNDGGEWIRDGGAAIWVESAQRCFIRRVRAHGGQNGIVLDRCYGSLVVDCDCSFLSGWGIALWRSSQCMVARNAVDFCVRGYSHGAYNRGQDSAGILCFEGSWGNVFARNSATHCGDGFFGFAGEESLGRRHGIGCGMNLLLANDFSFAVAHGMEMTFSDGNRFVRNRVEGAAICGLWGGYSRDSTAEGNEFVRCGDRGYGAERGGINIEHGQAWQVTGNRFEGGPMGIRLWWDEDPELLTRPWVATGGGSSSRYGIEGNVFSGLETAIELERTDQVELGGNAFEGCAIEVRADAASGVTRADGKVRMPGRAKPIDWDRVIELVPGTRSPIGARRTLGGREAIRIGEWGPIPPEGALPGAK